MLPCGLAAGIAGASPTAGSYAPSWSRRHASATPPMSATMRAKLSETLIALLPLVVGRLAEVNLRWNRRSACVPGMTPCRDQPLGDGEEGGDQTAVAPL